MVALDYPSVESIVHVPEGRHALRFEFEVTGGTVHAVTIDVSGNLIEDDEATLRRLLARQ